MAGLVRWPWRAPVDLVGDHAPCSWSERAIGGLVGLATLFLTLGSERARAQDPCGQDPTSSGCELVLPPVCSRDPAASTAPADTCEVTALPGPPGRKRVQVNLNAGSTIIKVGGYSVKTENYNGSYLSPVVEAAAGDMAAARLENRLEERQPSDPHVGGHGGATENPTNLHYFHGGIVTPNNARRANDPNDEAASKGNGDNIYVYLKRNAAAFTFEVPISQELDARVLELPGVIPHPSGLNWYHSHLHGWSSDQVMGGLSGLLSVGDAKANVVACRPDPANPGKCLDEPSATSDLKARTDVRYALLRDISLKDISALPEAVATTAKTATWAPEDKDWPKALGQCRVWLPAGGPPQAGREHRKGYCQRDEKKAWLFTINGQRFPTITVEGGRNLLLRLGNLSANLVYWLELYNEADPNEKLKLTLLSIDGVVPATVGLADPNKLPVKAVPVDDLILMPASRAEIYVRNDCLRPQEKTYILSTKGLVAGNDIPRTDRWPEIQLARIVLKPSAVPCTVDIALNAVASSSLPSIAMVPKTAARVEKPPGCVDDLDPEKREHRRVTFVEGGEMSNGTRTAWSILTEIVRPPAGATPGNPAKWDAFEPVLEKTVGLRKGNSGPFRGIPFEEYDRGGGKIDWGDTKDSPKHVCVFINPDDPQHKGSHKQLWVLHNETSALHNFHIHQMKFRLATAKELKDDYLIKLDDPDAPEPSETCPTAQCAAPNYKLYGTGIPDEQTKWHDTIPMPPDRRVYLIMSFDADEQVGRYVFHCHILKHEDSGLMAPIEVWKPTPAQ
jgi:FtsP/CotA-like multicopper oxidase with cupredoxin domain